MRKRIPLTGFPAFRAAWLREADVALFRRVADQGRTVLGIGRIDEMDEPRFDDEGSRDWTFGFLTYGYKDRLERLASRLSDDFGWPETKWFIPRYVLEWVGGDAFLHVKEEDEEAALALVHIWKQADAEAAAGKRLEWRSEVDREAYLTNAARLLERIHRGDIYELNYCIARTAHDPTFDPYAAFDELLERTDAPFAGFLKWGQRFAVCMSPERFLAFDERLVRGEPMKGTRPRGSDHEEDADLMAELEADAKERSENIMAVDVMRNDLSRVCDPGSVSVSALCEVRTYPRVHQMVSTIEGRLSRGCSPFDAVRAAFPMASMTGAPKISAMRLIDEHEARARGLYSGAMGFFAPDGTGDLNVIIRTILFDASDGRLRIQTGSALTAQCVPAAEWEECRVKFNSIADAL